jgi:hypothetical protein
LATFAEAVIADRRPLACGGVVSTMVLMVMTTLASVRTRAAGVFLAAAVARAF